MLPMGVFDELNFCILQDLDSNLFKDSQIAIKTAGILQKEFVFQSPSRQTLQFV